MRELKQDYNVKEYAPDFFLGSDGGDTAYCKEKENSYIFEIPFIGMSKKEALFLSSSF